ncbi:developmentally-regulated GTP-binding protein [Acrasis kona]|uniref:Developmentally-regulated GTP-binding protein n=1 Tax=Acrasis kona TaxID=1008807 RepID=A0AAW2Z6K6_9EUKA
MGILEKIKDIENEIQRTQKNKATEYHLGILKAKLARYRSQLMEGDKKSGGGDGTGFEARKAGDARVAMIGFPSVGKSTLLNKITKTESEVGAYEYTTLTCIPGVINYKGSDIQLLDLPGIIEGASEGKGRGRQVIATARTADLVLMMLDASKGEVHKKLLQNELESVGIRLNKQKPAIYYKPKASGGLHFTATAKQTHGLNEKLVRDILHGYRIFNAEVILRYDATIDDFIDVVEGNRQYIPCVYVYNKIDTCNIEDIDAYARKAHSIVVSCEWELNLEYLIDQIWENLSLIRVYTKKRANPPDFQEPCILRSGSSIEDICDYIHRDLKKSFKYALVWGRSAKHTPQRCGLAHRLADEDVVQIITAG